MEWDCSSVGDVIADSVVALIMHAQSSAASIRLTAQPCRHRRNKKPREDGEDPKKAAEEYLRALHHALSDQFLCVEATYEASKGTFEVKIDAAGDDKVGEEENEGALLCTATVELDEEMEGTAKITVESEDDKLATNVRQCLQNVALASAPIVID